ncbi:MAG: MtnX-like HAD-IB family phosphatase [Ignavibacteria bacterium]|nr:MtnX-like HAD-IB family phosphatase [Ignavibacteria bacterium]
MATRIYVDFDGTITREDVGDAFFRKFGGEECVTAVQEYREGRISARECFRREAASIGVLEVAAANALIDQQVIDESFIDFVRYSRERDFPLTIVSDGLDYYILRILSRHDVDAVEVFSNTLGFTPTGRSGWAAASVSFPYADAECDRCACCKRNIMLNRSAEHDVIVLVGEGYSDRCPAQFADIVFARDELQTFCQRENISYYLYSSFRDVVARLELLQEKGPLRKRASAEQERRRVFLQG